MKSARTAGHDTAAQARGIRRRKPGAIVAAMRTVLLISDAGWVHNDVTAALDLPGTRIAIEENPRAVLETAAQEGPSVYLVDMQVGSMGGMALTRQLRDAIHATDIPAGRVIMLLDRQADGFLAKRAGADGWVTKPFTAQELRATIDTAEPAQA